MAGTTDRIPAIESAHLITSLRASEFDIPSAIGELVDNSVQVNSSIVHLYVDSQDLRGKKRSYRPITKIICGDNGTGMEAGVDSVLHKCIKLGYSTRYDDRNGIGRFGVGMTLAGIKYATRIEVYSKVQGGVWNYISFDINDKEDLEDGIKPPIAKSIPPEYAKYAGIEHGTLVIWSNFDRVHEADARATTWEDKFPSEYSLNPLGELNHWLGRTYRHFIISNKLSLFLNEKKVYSFDPLYLNKTENQFPDDVPAEVAHTEELDWPIPGKKGTSKIKVKITKLPSEWREEEGRGGRPFKGRYIDENEGISIVRAGREVFFDYIPHFKTRDDNGRSQQLIFDKKDRYWGCEICYEPELDECFTIKNIKRGVMPKDPDLKATLCNTIKPVRDQILREVVCLWNDNKTKASTSSSHIIAEDIVNENDVPGQKKAGKGQTEEEQKQKMTLLLETLEAQDRTIVENKFKAQDFQIIDANWFGPSFIDLTYIGGKVALKYNRSHIFMKEICEIKDNMVKGNGDLTELAIKLNSLIDLLFMSLARARQEFGQDDQQYSAEDLMSKLTSDWGNYANSYLKKLKKNGDEGC